MLSAGWGFYKDVISVCLFVCQNITQELIGELGRTTVMFLALVLKFQIEGVDLYSVL